MTNLTTKILEQEKESMTILNHEASMQLTVDLSVRTLQAGVSMLKHNVPNIISLLESNIERLKGMKIEDIPEIVPSVYNRCLEDEVSYYSQTIDELKKNI